MTTAIAVLLQFAFSLDKQGSLGLLFERPCRRVHHVHSAEGAGPVFAALITTPHLRFLRPLHKAILHHQVSETRPVTLGVASGHFESECFSLGLHVIVRGSSQLGPIVAI